ncbi:MAG: hypothetical protein GWP19_07905, partial [Planctomycetia bacterium]|nr:hypothetical protein [Planctomycetia bacterium]
MSDWKKQLSKITFPVEAKNAVIVNLPNRFIFKSHGIYRFNPIFDFFDWTIKDSQVIIDFTKCRVANYQALSLIVLYSWKLRSQGCRISYNLDLQPSGASIIWKKMGAGGLFHVSTDHETNFKHNLYKPLIAIRNVDDFKKALTIAEEYTEGFNIEFKKTLSHILSELLFNTQEHGISKFSYRGTLLNTPSLIQFTWYQNRNEIDFIIADTGIGIKNHLSQTYHGIDTDIHAIQMAIKPQVSGTFGFRNPYTNKDNAGIGLYISTNIIRTLKANMYIISGNGVLHVSPRDITTEEILNPWPGTIVLVSVKLNDEFEFAFHSIMQSFRESARKELKIGSTKFQEDNIIISIENHLGFYAEDKKAAIKIRTDKIMPNIHKDKKIVLDFNNVKKAPHSLLSALIATPIKNLGL